MWIDDRTRHRGVHLSDWRQWWLACRHFFHDGPAADLSVRRVRCSHLWFSGDSQRSGRRCDAEQCHDGGVAERRLELHAKRRPIHLVWWCGRRQLGAASVLSSRRQLHELDLGRRRVHHLVLWREQWAILARRHEHDEGRRSRSCRPRRTVLLAHWDGARPSRRFGRLFQVHPQVKVLSPQGGGDELFPHVCLVLAVACAVWLAKGGAVLRGAAQCRVDLQMSCRSMNMYAIVACRSTYSLCQC
mmetsp:Transcript_7749/g.16977  ORF Transcript_7749/g.16977 Transcript_7749/m.16977 type:complete len:244 (-) Transcript_7749:108-839(-)